MHKVIKQKRLLFKSFCLKTNACFVCVKNTFEMMSYINACCEIRLNMVKRYAFQMTKHSNARCEIRYQYGQTLRISSDETQKCSL